MEFSLDHVLGLRRNWALEIFWTKKGVGPNLSLERTT